MGRMVEFLNCGSVKRTTPGLVLTFMTWLVTIRMAGVLTQRAQHGALWTHLWHVPGIAEWVPTSCMTISDAWGWLCTLSIGNTDWLVLTARASASITERRARTLCIERIIGVARGVCQFSE
jgi:hypothetical protein